MIKKENNSPAFHEDIKSISLKEGVSLKQLTGYVKKGTSIVISSRRGKEPVGIGKDLRSKFACIVGTSAYELDMDTVVKKAQIAVKHGASVIHNGSTGGNVKEVHKRLLDEVDAPLAICHPVNVMANASYEKRNFLEMSENEFIEQVEEDIELGTEIVILPLGITQKVVSQLATCNRIMPCCSKAGAIMSSWIFHNKRENPYCRRYDDILKMAKENNTTISIVGSFRSGNLHDALDELQYAELNAMKEFVKRAQKAGVQIKAGSGGHIPADKISGFFRYQKKLLSAPIISFGPQVTDISVGLDHISAAMGQIIALLSGADLIFTMTPSEHFAMPDIDHTIQGCNTAKIVCHSADVASGKDGHLDDTISKARVSMDWKKQSEFALDESVRKIVSDLDNRKNCSICGTFCAYDSIRSHIKNKIKIKKS